MNKMYFSRKSEITQQEYLMLLGLKALATEHEKQLLQIKTSMAKILEEVDKDGVDRDDPTWAGELTYTERAVDDVLKILEIQVIN